MERLDVNIMGREYSLACEPEERESLVTASNLVDRTMQRLKTSGKIAGTERIAVMAALQLATELLNAKSPDGSLSELAVGDYKRRIEDINRILDTTLGAQEKLF